MSAGDEQSGFLGRVTVCDTVPHTPDVGELGRLPLNWMTSEQLAAVITTA